MTTERLRWWSWLVWRNIRGVFLDIYYVIRYPGLRKRGISEYRAWTPRRNRGMVYDRRGTLLPRVWGEETSEKAYERLVRETDMEDNE